MSYTINEYCLNCGACMDICPEGAIIEGEERSSIDPTRCNECGICIKEFFCPAQAIGPDKAAKLNACDTLFDNNAEKTGGAY